MLQDNLDKAIDLIEQSNENKRTEKESSEAIRKNNSFFNGLEQLSNTVNIYVLVKEKFGFVISVDVKEQLNQLMEYAYQMFQRENVTDVRTFQKNVDKVTKDIEQEWNIFFSGSLVSVNHASEALVPSVIHRSIRARLRSSANCLYNFFLELTHIPPSIIICHTIL